MVSSSDEVLISIIIPFFNAQSKIPLFLASISNQDCRNVEFVFIDDGSTDETINLIKQHFKKNNDTHVITSKVNGGVSSARNLGLRIAQGKYVIFVDSDDALLSGAISKIKDKVNDNIKSEVLIFEYLRFNEENKHEALNSLIFERKFSEVTVSKMLNEYISGNLIRCIHVCSCVYKRDFLKKNNIIFDEKFSYGEDQKFIIDCLAVSKIIKYFKFPILSYIDYVNSATGVYNKKWFHSYEVFNSIRKRSEFLPYNKQLENRMNEELLTIANKMLLQCNFNDSVSFLRKSVIPLAKRTHKLKFFILFNFPELFIILYKLYKTKK